MQKQDELWHFGRVSVSMQSGGREIVCRAGSADLRSDQIVSQLDGGLT